MISSTLLVGEPGGQWAVPDSPVQLMSREASFLEYLVVALAGGEGGQVGPIPQEDALTIPVTGPGKTPVEVRLVEEAQPFFPAARAALVVVPREVQAWFLRGDSPGPPNPAGVVDQGFRVGELPLGVIDGAQSPTGSAGTREFALGRARAAHPASGTGEHCTTPAPRLTPGELPFQECADLAEARSESGIQPVAVDLPAPAMSLNNEVSLQHPEVSQSPRGQPSPAGPTPGPSPAWGRHQAHQLPERHWEGPDGPIHHGTARFPRSLVEHFRQHSRQAMSEVRLRLMGTPPLDETCSAPVLGDPVQPAPATGGGSSPVVLGAETGWWAGTQEARRDTGDRAGAVLVASSPGWAAAAEKGAPVRPIASVATGQIGMGESLRRHAERGEVWLVNEEEHPGNLARDRTEDLLLGEMPPGYAVARPREGMEGPLPAVPAAHAVLPLTAYELASPDTLPLVSASAAHPGSDVDLAQRVLQQTLSAIGHARASGRETLVLRLEPAELGNISLRLIRTDAGLTARFVASAPLTQQLLIQQLDSLSQALHQHGLVMEEAGVYTGDGSQTHHHRHPPPETGRPLAGADADESGLEEPVVMTSSRLSLRV